jgi:hypothetical protein
VVSDPHVLPHHLWVGHDDTLPAPPRHGRTPKTAAPGTRQAKASPAKPARSSPAEPPVRRAAALRADARVRPPSTSRRSAGAEAGSSTTRRRATRAAANRTATTGTPIVKRSAPPKLTAKPSGRAAAAGRKQFEAPSLPGREATPKQSASAVAATRRAGRPSDAASATGRTRRSAAGERKPRHPTLEAATP